MQDTQKNTAREGEQGFMLVGVIVLVFLVFLALSIAAPKVARNLRREREVESIHRGNEYVRAIQLYYRKFGRYPGTMDQLEKTSNMRFLRQKYPDPLTGKPNWRLIHVGEAKTTVKGFFGKPLAGIGGGAGGLGAASSMVSSGQPGSTVNGTSTGSSSGFGSPMGSSSPTGSSSSGFSLGSSSSTTPGSSSASGATVSSSSGSSGSSSGIGSQSATSFTGGGAPIVGIGSSRSGASITILNEQTTYQTWEFIYDPRIEQMKAKAAVLGGGVNSGFGSGSGSSSGSGSGSGFGGSSPTNSSPFSSTPSPAPSGGSGSGSSGTISPTNPQ